MPGPSVGPDRGPRKVSDRLGDTVSPLVGQVLLVTDGQTVAVPDGALFAFAEVIGPGGQAGSGFSSGGGGSDAIIPVTVGKTFIATLPRFGSNASIAYDGAMLIVGGVGGNTGTNVGGTGKYPGEAFNPGIGQTTRGGGRLAGQAVPTSTGNPPNIPGHGAGARAATNQSAFGGLPLGCVTFFRLQDAARAFANSLYGGNWQP